LIKLYSGRILSLAANIPMTDRLADPDQSIKSRSPLCGSVVTVDLNFENGLIASFGQDVKACALGQAAAAILAEKVIGRSMQDIQKAHDQLLGMLKENGPIPDAPFDGFEVLLPAREYKNRHASIMLALNSTLEGFKKNAAT